MFILTKSLKSLCFRVLHLGSDRTYKKVIDVYVGIMMHLLAAFVNSSVMVTMLPNITGIGRQVVRVAALKPIRWYFHTLML